MANLINSVTSAMAATGQKIRSLENSVIELASKTTALESQVIDGHEKTWLKLDKVDAELAKLKKSVKWLTIGLVCSGLAHIVIPFIK